jgi:hypothetical protein
MRDPDTALAQNVVLVDVVDELPRRRPFPKRADEIDRLIIHHSGALGAPGYAGMKGSAQYTIAPKQGKPGGRGFAYTFWAPYKPPAFGPLTIFRGNRDDVRSAHTSRWNDRGVALVLQGNLGALGGPSTAQITMLEAFVPWAIARYDLVMPQGLTYHRECTGKKLCPGGAAEVWIEAFRTTWKPR